MPDETRAIAFQTLGSNAALSAPMLALVLSYQSSICSPHVGIVEISTNETSASSSSSSSVPQGITPDEVAAGEELCRLLTVDPRELSEQRFGELQALWR